MPDFAIVLLLQEKMKRLEEKEKELQPLVDVGIPGFDIQEGTKCISYGDIKITS